MSAKSDPRAEREHAIPRFYYRRTLTGRDLLPAAGVAVAAGLVAFYVARILLGRTPLSGQPERGPRARVPRAHGG